jgi:hypothetical protein
MIASAPRPDVDVSAYLPDLHEELRWPLTVQTHPMLEPHFPIARELAQPGIGWQQLCTPAVLGRHVVGSNANELMEYLRGWCAAAGGDVDVALEHFSRVRGSVVSGLAAALVYDVPFVLCEQTSNVAERLLDKHAMNDVRILDVLAAAYVEIGRDDDAAAINRRAIAFARGRTNDASFCHRGAREVILGGRLDVLETEKGKSKDPTCIELLDALACSIRRDCVPYIVNQQKDEKLGHLLDAYLQWPTGSNDYTHWRAVVHHAAKALPLPGADELGRAALPALIRASSCGDTQLSSIREYAAQLSRPELRGLSLAACKNLALTTGD